MYESICGSEQDWASRDEASSIVSEVLEGLQGALPGDPVSVVRLCAQCCAARPGIAS